MLGIKIWIFNTDVPGPRNIMRYSNWIFKLKLCFTFILFIELINAHVTEITVLLRDLQGNYLSEDKVILLMLHGLRGFKRCRVGNSEHSHYIMWFTESYCEFITCSCKLLFGQLMMPFLFFFWPWASWWFDKNWSSGNSLCQELTWMTLPVTWQTFWIYFVLL